MVLWRPARPSRTNTKKRCPFHHGGLECKSRKSGDIWSNRQVWPWSTKWGRAKANRVLSREHTGHSKHPLPTTQEHHQMVCTKIRLIIFFATKDGEALYSQQKTRPGANYGSDHELLIAKFRLKLEKVGKTTSQSNPLWLYSGGIRSGRPSAWRTVDRGS